MNHHPYRHAAGLTAITATAFLLASCGGGGGTSAAPAAGAAATTAPAGTSAAPAGTTGTQSAAPASATPPAATSASTAGTVMAGTVTGFGSVIVDGRRIDDRNAPAAIELEDGSIVNTELKIGHHVEIRHGDDLVASEVRVNAEVRGLVESVSTGAGRLQVLGQTVTVNTSASTGPVTVFEAPYTQLADIHGGDTVEVHGVQRVDAAGAVTFQATRIEPKPATVPARLKGSISALSTADRSFRIGTLLVRYGTALVKPGLSALADGAEVDLVLPAASTLTPGIVDAVKVSVKVRHGGAIGQDAAVAGPVSLPDATAKTFRIDGVRVNAENALFSTPGQGFADIVAGVYVRVKGTLAADGSLTATSLSLPQREHAAGREAELHGSIVGLAANGSFTVRGVAVGSTGATISCPAGTTLSDGMQVEVEGHLSATGEVVAAEVKCEDVLENVSIVERTGTASAVDAGAKRLTLGAGAGALTVQWSAGTVFVGIDATSLNGTRLEVEGTLAGAVLTAKKIKPEK